MKTFVEYVILDALVFLALGLLFSMPFPAWVARMENRKHQRYWATTVCSAPGCKNDTTYQANGWRKHDEQARRIAVCPSHGTAVGRRALKDAPLREDARRRSAHDWMACYPGKVKNHKKVVSLCGVLGYPLYDLREARAIDPYCAICRSLSGESKTDTTAPHALREDSRTGPTSVTVKRAGVRLRAMHAAYAAGAHRDEAADQNLDEVMRLLAVLLPVVDMHPASPQPVVGEPRTALPPGHHQVESLRWLNKQGMEP